MAQYLKCHHIKLQILVAVSLLFFLPLTAQAMLAIAFLTPFAVAITMVAGAVFGRFAMVMTAAFSFVVITMTAVKSLQF